MLLKKTFLYILILNILYIGDFFIGDFFPVYHFICPNDHYCHDRLFYALFRYLATGNTMTDLHYTYRIGISTISGIIEEVCTKIWELRNECMAEPSEEKWKEIANGFQKLANFPNCIGALDGKHVRIIKPTKSGSLFYNYKHYFSIVLMAICDANYCFTFVDVGAQGKFCDSSVFKNSNFYQKLENGTLKIPCPMPFPENEEESNPFVIVADEAFGLSKNILRPYARNNLNYKKKIFNYRLSRARRNIECSFGILSNKFRIFHKPMNVSVELAVCIVKASCILHNFIRVRDGYKFENTLFTEGLEPLHEVNNIQRHNDVTRCGTSIRDKFAQYFISDAGKVDWQDKCI